MDTEFVPIYVGEMNYIMLLQAENNIQLYTGQNLGL